jgi:phage tail-like protein
MGYPFTAFNFSIAITPDGARSPLCQASFAECDGLEMTLDVKTIREGGNNGVQVKLSGPAGYGQLTLKRGMTASFDLWQWFEQVISNPATRATGEVKLLAPDQTPQATFVLTRCVPLKIKAPPLNAKDGIVAIEEMQVGYESLTITPGGGHG